MQYFDALMTEYGIMLAPYLPNMQVEVKTRTSGILHEAGMPPSEGPPLDAETCSKWITAFAYHRVMCIWALGPDEGTLELQPFDDESNNHRVSMRPGTLVVLRPDALSHRFSAGGRAYCLTCFFQKEARQCKHRDNTVAELTPCCRALEDWAEERLKEYKESFPEEQARMTLPRHWESVMNHTSFVGQPIVVRTSSIKQCASYQPVPWAEAFAAGPDFVIEIPLMRWDHSWHYDPDPQGWQNQKTNCRHGSFIDGSELFDNTLFRISRAEAAGMDPGHRMTMETGYEALIRDGHKISNIMNSRGGVYVANPPPTEWGLAEKDCTSSGVCGGGGSIACGRFSFVHGLKGPCISIDVEAASSLVTINFACTNLSRTGKWEPIPFAVCQSWNLILTPTFLFHASAGGRLSVVGRNFCYDACAGGFVRGECAISLLLKAMTSQVDDEVVVNESGNFLGALVGTATNQSGRRAALTAPDGTAMQDVIYEALRQAEISPLDVDSIETASDARVLDDALEAAATGKALRPEGMAGLEETSPIGLMALKTTFGNQVEAQGYTAILKVCLSASFGSMTPNLHLRIANPHLDVDCCDRSVQMPSEALEFRLASSYTGITNRSAVGTNCHVICWGQVNDDHCPLLPEATFQRDKIFFWPEGGGALEDGMVPKRGYSIIGSWNKWEPEPLETEAPGVYAYTVTLGENRWERFQILLDQDRRKVLYPGHDRLEEVTKGAPVAGPEEVFQSESWLIDTRPYFGDEPAGEGEALVAVDGGALDRQDVGQPGDRFRVRFSVKGKWRMAEWENLDRAKDRGAEPEPSVPMGQYQVSGSWNHGLLEEMKPSPDVPGLFTAEVTLTTDGGTFQILRNRDWAQALYPDTPEADASASTLGPDEPVGHAWFLEGSCGDVFEIQFQRSSEGGRDEKKVSWKFVRKGVLTQAQLTFAARPLFFIMGTWDERMGMHRMHFTGEYYQFYVQLGKVQKESFQIFKEGRVTQCIHPSVADASPFEKHDLQGPHITSASLAWTIGAHAADDAAPGKRYEVRLRVSDEDYAPEKVDWIPVKGLEGLEDAKGRGFLVLGQ